MLEESDIMRLLVELMPQFVDGDSIGEWLERENISEDAWNKLATDITEIVFSDPKTIDGRTALKHISAGMQLAFFIGWECAKQYSPRDMS